MTKRQDLCLQRRSRPEQSDQRQPNQAANISHQPRASPNSTPLASRIEFPTMTGGLPASGSTRAAYFNARLAVQVGWSETAAFGYLRERLVGTAGPQRTVGHPRHAPSLTASH